MIYPYNQYIIEYRGGETASVICSCFKKPLYIKAESDENYTKVTQRVGWRGSVLRALEMLKPVRGLTKEELFIELL